MLPAEREHHVVAAEDAPERWHPVMERMTSTAGTNVWWLKNATYVRHNIKEAVEWVVLGRPSVTRKEGAFLVVGVVLGRVPEQGPGAGREHNPDQAKL